MIVTCVAACGRLNKLNVWQVVSKVRTDTGTKFFQGGQSHDSDMCRGMRAVEYAQCLASCVKSED
jgi:hypothetical protein